MGQSHSQSLFQISALVIHSFRIERWERVEADFKTGESLLRKSPRMFLNHPRESDLNTCMRLVEVLDIIACLTRSTTI